MASESEVSASHVRDSGALRKGPDNSLLTFLGNIGVIVLVILNVLSLLLGIGIIVVGNQIDKGIDKNDNITKLLDKVDFGSFTLMQIVDVIIIVIYVIGAVAIVISLSGGLGALLKLRVLLAIYIVFLVLMIFLELAVLGIWIELLRQVHTRLQGLFDDLLKKYTGFDDITFYTVGWDFIFILFNCCGVRPVTATYNDFQALPSEFWASSSRGNDVIPFACCKDVSVENYLNYNNTVCTVQLQDYQTSGCYDIFRDTFTVLGKAAISVVGIIVLIEAVAIFFSIVIIIAVSKKKKLLVV
ncbi:CD82 antigen-like [Dreissena polymorpha]|uniref:Tetraspanin n=1 Tax=Dreissena polymorpha TaxID=45954 RepID=A0A9D4MYH9_DREPO|nr:CD82 antigen-like [Dreissena polymorpha]KAH3886267.1 hypothetical protein DPMN_010269 [Dreissena polymorpha]